jgi:hypothetical protein
LSDPRSLRFELSPSPLLAAMIVAAHAAAAAGALAALPGPAGWALAAGLAGLGFASARSRALLKAAQSVRAIELDGEAVLLELSSGERVPAGVSRRRYVSRFIVNVRVAHPVRRTILVFRDMLAEDSFRRLRIWGIWGKLPGVAGKQLPS